MSTTIHPSIALLPQALTALYLSRMLNTLLSGFALELFSPEDYLSTWWIAHRLASRLGSVWEELESMRGVGLTAHKLEAQVLCQASLGSLLVRQCCRILWLSRQTQWHAEQNERCQSTASSSHTSPLFLDMRDADVSRKARFNVRFQWLQGPGLEEVADWDLFLAETQSPFLRKVRPVT